MSSGSGWNHFRKFIKPVEELEPEYKAAELVEKTDLSLAQIAEQAGLANAGEVKKALRLPQVAGFLSKCLDDAGATLEAAAKVIADAQAAEKKTYGIYKGEIVDERSDVDHGTRLSAAELNLKARGAMRDSGPSLNIFMDLTDEQVAAIADGKLDPATLMDRGPRITED